ncbi:hypothetical protein BV898_06907 [Hypsibius exemplaris]|uniref:Dynein assembly factor 3 C-terminal domain-containing protein n=1 Tax=Hypsibius exemplaris TaxID=2072580 RepID=A0A1W0WV80_HYPEX|nr:hypothetical protein BV898_06907 [Hypsibius exemplaris]
MGGFEDGPDGKAGEEWRSRYKVIFLSPGPFSAVSEREKYRELFDVAYVGGHSLLDSVSGLARTLKSHAAVIFETPKYLIGLPKSRCSDYYRVVKDKFSRNGFDVSRSYNEKEDDHFTFGFTRFD